MSLQDLSIEEQRILHFLKFSGGQPWWIIAGSCNQYFGTNINSEDAKKYLASLEKKGLVIDKRIPKRFENYLEDKDLDLSEEDLVIYARN